MPHGRTGAKVVICSNVAKLATVDAYFGRIHGVLLRVDEGVGGASTEDSVHTESSDGTPLETLGTPFRTTSLASLGQHRRD